MSLSIFFISKDEGIETDLEKDINIISDLEEEVNQHCSSVFGFESFRNSLWGHEIIKTLGCEMVYSLKEYDIYAFNENILKLKSEFLIILENLDLVEKETGIEKDAIEVRVNNALAYIEVAERNSDKVGIFIG